MQPSDPSSPSPAGSPSPDPISSGSSSSGWFPDPTGRYEYRYHNGQRWTNDVSVDGVRYVDPTALSPDPSTGWPAGSHSGGDASSVSAPTGLPVAGVVPLPPGVIPRAPGRGRAILAFLLGLGGVALA